MRVSKPRNEKLSDSRALSFVLPLTGGRCSYETKRILWVDERHVAHSSSIIILPPSESPENPARPISSFFFHHRTPLHAALCRASEEPVKVPPGSSCSTCD